MESGITISDSQQQNGTANSRFGVTHPETVRVKGAKAGIWPCLLTRESLYKWRNITHDDSGDLQNRQRVRLSAELGKQGQQTTIRSLVNFILQGPSKLDWPTYHESFLDGEPQKWLDIGFDFAVFHKSREFMAVDISLRYQASQDNPEPKMGAIHKLGWFLSWPFQPANRWVKVDGSIFLLWYPPSYAGNRAIHFHPFAKERHTPVMILTAGGNQS